jgi:hypothetical protein
MSERDPRLTPEGCARDLVNEWGITDASDGVADPTASAVFKIKAYLEQEAKMAREEERERCAKIAEDYYGSEPDRDYNH